MTWRFVTPLMWSSYMCQMNRAWADPLNKTLSSVRPADLVDQDLGHAAPLKVTKRADFGKINFSYLKFNKNVFEYVIELNAANSKFY